MSKFTIFALDGSVRAVTDTLELHDEWMAECFVTLTIKSAVPIDFEVGDYLDYRGDRYTINYDPTVIKKARRGTHGEGFVYDNIKFVSVQDEIVRCDFSDLVLADNNIHYTSLPTFPFFCETVDDLLDRIQACLEELYPGRWTIVCLDFDRSRQRGEVVGRESDFINAYNTYIGPGTEFKYEKTGVALTADNITCWDALKYVNDYFGLNFIVRGFNVIVGTAGVFTPRTFRYGKGKGLYEIERISDSEQRIITRLRAYGSEDNLPSRYYANLNSRIYGLATMSEEGVATLDVAFRKDYFTNPFSGSETDVKVEINGVGYDAKAYINSNTGGIIINTQTMDMIEEGTRIYMVSGVKKDAWPDDHREYNTDNLPDNMSISRLMLPGFPNQTLHDWVMEHKDIEGNEYLLEMIDAGFEFSTDKYRPYIDSPNKNIYGIRPASIYFDGSNETDNIHPTIEGMTYRGFAIDEIEMADTITDNGVFGNGEVPNFTITLPALGFDLGEVYQSGASIDMKDGMCGGRSFEMASKPVQNDSEQWVCTVKRSQDTTLDLFFPYSDFQIRHGDHYVLTGIYMPDEYVNKAAERLLKAAYDALLKNHAPQFTFQPRIDEIWMARQHDTSVESGGATPSLHDTLKAGDIFVFEDEDLGIEGRIIIDILTIKENGNNGIPTYEVTLRNEKVVSAIQKTISKVESAISGGGAGAGNGYTTRQIGSLIETEGSDLFLSKIEDDEAQGVIGFLKGVWFGIRDWFIDASGNANLNDIVANGVLRAYNSIINRVKSSNFSGYGMLDSGWQIINDYEGYDSYAVFDRLYIRKKAIFEELELRKISHIGGNFCLSPASGRVWRVECYDAEVGGNLLGYDEYTVPYTLGGRVLALFSHSLANRFLSRKRRLARQLTPEEIARVKRIRVYMFSDDGTTKTMQNWTVGAQARCQTFNIEEQMDHISGGESDNPDVDYWTGKKVQNTYWWRMVYATGEAECEDGKKHAYIEFLENQTNQRTHSDVGSDIPSVGDEFAQFGHRTEPTQQNVIMIETANPDSPSMKFYKGVNSWSLNGKRKTVLSPAGTEIYSQRYHIETEYDDVIVPMERGEWEQGVEYYYYNRVSHNGSLWLCIAVEGTSTTEEPSESSTVWIKQVGRGQDATTTAQKYTGPLAESATKPTIANYKQFTWTDTAPVNTQALPDIYVALWKYTAGTELDINNTPPYSVSLFAHYGDDGKNGTSIVAAPNAIIINQQRVSTGGAEPLTNINYPIVVVARDSGTIVKSTVSNLTTTNCTASITKNNVTDSTVTITAISKYTEGGKEKYRTSGAVAFHVTAQTAKGDTFQADISVPFGCNLLGQYTIDIEEDVKTEVSSKVTSEIDSRNLVNVTEMNTTVQQSAAGLTTEINKVNNRLNAGGDIGDTVAYNNTHVQTAESNISTLTSQMAGTTESGLNTKITNTNSRVSTAESDISTLKTTTSSQGNSITSLNTRVSTAESDISSLKTTTSSQGTSITSLNSRMSTAESNITTLRSDLNTTDGKFVNYSTTAQTSTMISNYVVEATTPTRLANGGMWESGSIYGEDTTKDYDDCKTDDNTRLRTKDLFPARHFVNVAVPSDKRFAVHQFGANQKWLRSTSWMTPDSNTGNCYVSLRDDVYYVAFLLRFADDRVISTDNISGIAWLNDDADVLAKTGINISKRTIELRGDNVTFTNSEGSASGKIWIDPTSGTLHATDADLTGKMTVTSGSSQVVNINSGTNSSSTTASNVTILDSAGIYSRGSDDGFRLVHDSNGTRFERYHAATSQWVPFYAGRAIRVESRAGGSYAKSLYATDDFILFSSTDGWFEMPTGVRDGKVISIRNINGGTNTIKPAYGQRIRDFDGWHTYTDHGRNINNDERAELVFYNNVWYLNMIGS